MKTRDPSGVLSNTQAMTSLPPTVQTMMSLRQFTASLDNIRIDCETKSSLIQNILKMGISNKHVSTFVDCTFATVTQAHIDQQGEMLDQQIAALVASLQRMNPTIFLESSLQIARGLATRESLQACAACSTDALQHCDPSTPAYLASIQASNAWCSERLASTIKQAQELAKDLVRAGLDSDSQKRQRIMQTAAIFLLEQLIPVTGIVRASMMRPEMLAEMRTRYRCPSESSDVDVTDISNEQQCHIKEPEEPVAKKFYHRYGAISSDACSGWHELLRLLFEPDFQGETLREMRTLVMKDIRNRLKHADQDVSVHPGNSEAILFLQWYRAYETPEVTAAFYVQAAKKLRKIVDQSCELRYTMAARRKLLVGSAVESLPEYLHNMNAAETTDPLPHITLVDNGGRVAVHAPNVEGTSLYYQGNGFTASVERTAQLLAYAAIGSIRIARPTGRGSMPSTPLCAAWLQSLANQLPRIAETRISVKAYTDKALVVESRLSSSAFMTKKRHPAGRSKQHAARKTESIPTLIA